ncbi:hypothetical protein BJV78DRAFT_1289784 [Lactifluus subvellereus]|nr:hypothetical protein BJV78DRAFT_1289784 [Lactifluus subvellereus]
MPSPSPAPRSPLGLASWLDMSGLHRALSPTPIAAALAMDSGFAQALETVSTIDEVVAAILVHYCDAIGPITHEITNACHRAVSFRKQLATLELALTTGEHPPQVVGSLKVLDLQLMQEYRLANPEAVMLHEEAAKSEIWDAHTKFLELGIAALTNQVNFFTDQCAPDVALARLSEAMKMVTKVLVNNHLVRTIAQVIHSDGTSHDMLRTSISTTELLLQPRPPRALTCARPSLCGSSWSSQLAY